MASSSHAIGDLISGGFGDDTIVASMGADVGRGASTIDGGSGADSITGGAGQDRISDGSGTDDVVAGDGDDWLIGTGGFFDDDVWDGGIGSDTWDVSIWLVAPNLLVDLSASLANLAGNVVTLNNIENVRATKTPDTIIGSAADNRLDGFQGGDTITGGHGTDTLLGGAGDDLLDAGVEYGEVMDGGLGADTVDYSWIGAGVPDIVIDLQAGTFTDLGGSETLLNIEHVVASSSSETLVGNSADNWLRGGDGDDTVSRRGGADTLDAGNGIDRLFGGNGDDLLIQNFGTAEETLHGGAGIDTADWSYSGGSWLISLVDNTAILGGTTYASLLEIENLTGAEGNDSLNGSAGANVLSGGLGNDTFDSAEGADTVNGGDGDDFALLFDDADLFRGEAGDDTANGVGGDDVLLGGDGADWLIGSSGDDTVLGGAGDDKVSPDDGADVLMGGGGIDTLDWRSASGGFSVRVDLTQAGPQDTLRYGLDTIAQFENVLTDGGNAELIGDGKDNFLDGGVESDTLVGNGGDDTLHGGHGADTVSGGNGVDYIYGGQGRDILFGGSNEDRFYYNTAEDSGVGKPLSDVIRDFSTADTDLIDLADVYVGILAYIGAAAFTAAGGGEVRVIADGADQLVQVDTDDDGAADMEITVKDAALTGGAADFVL